MKESGDGVTIFSAKSESICVLWPHTCTFYLLAGNLILDQKNIGHFLKVCSVQGKTCKLSWQEYSLYHTLTLCT